jgi:hypothetical protein
MAVVALVTDVWGAEMWYKSCVARETSEKLGAYRLLPRQVLPGTSSHKIRLILSMGCIYHLTVDACSWHLPLIFLCSLSPLQ